MSGTPDEPRARTVEGTVQGVGFRPYVYRLAGELGRRRPRAQRRARGRGRGRGAAGDRRALPDAAAARGAAAGARSSGSPRSRVDELGERGFSIRESPAGGRAARRGHAGQRDLRRLPRRAVRPGRPALPLPVRQLHQLRAALHDRARRPVRPAEHDDGRLRDVRGLPRRVPRPGRPPLPRPAQRLPRVRAAVRSWLRGLRRRATRSRRRRRRCVGGAIVAVKGIGGFHLACRADDEAAVARLRARKHREDKPFALMAPDLAAARELVALGAGGGGAARSRGAADRAGPRRPARRVAPPVAPRARRARRDAALLAAPPPAAGGRRRARSCMTSGNVSDEPIAFDDDGRARAARGDRGPVPASTTGRSRPAPTTASCARVPAGRAADAAALARLRAGRAARCRSTAARQLLACGAELKNTFAVAKGERAWVGPSRRRPRELRDAALVRDGIEHFQRLFAVAPEVVAHDLHPEYLSTKHALELDGRRARSACSTTTPTWRPASRSTASPARRSGRSSTAPATATTARSGAASCCSATCAASSAPASCCPVRMPGGEAAIRQPWRMACAWLAAAASAAPPPALAATSTRTLAPGRASWRAAGVASPLTTSIGPPVRRRRRALRDARGGQLRGPGGDRARGRARPRRARRATRSPVRDDGGPLVIDPRATVRMVARGRSRAACRSARVAARFHNAVAAATARGLRGCGRRCGHRDRRAVGRRLPEPAPAGAHRRAARSGAGLRVLTPERLPPNDGGIAYGQLAVAAARLRRRPMFGLDDSDLRAGATARRWLVVLAWRCCSGCATRPTRPPRRRHDADRLRSREAARARAGRLGLAWGWGTRSRSACSACRSCSSAPTCRTSVQRAAEAAVGLMIMFLAVRLLVRWRSGQFHAHAHRHGEVDAPSPAPARARHAARPRARARGAPGSLARRARSASAWSTGWAARRASACCCWRRSGSGRGGGGPGVLAVGTALSMALLSSAFGSRSPAARHSAGARVRAGDGRPVPRIRRLVRARRDRGVPYLL